MASENKRYHLSIARKESIIDKCESDIFLNNEHLLRINKDLNELKKQSLSIDFQNPMD